MKGCKLRTIRFQLRSASNLARVGGRSVDGPHACACAAGTSDSERCGCAVPRQLRCFGAPWRSWAA